jgi:2'-5' RNA ligase
MRCFVAVDIDESVRRSIAKLAGNIAAKGNFAKGNAR